MKILVPLSTALVLGAAVALAGGNFDDSDARFEGRGEGPVAGTLYDRIYARYAHLGRDVEEEFRDGPCKIERRWETDGDFKEKISCDGPRHWRRR